MSNSSNQPPVIKPTKLNQFAVGAIPPFGTKSSAPISYAQTAAKSKPSPAVINGKDALGTVIANSASALANAGAGGPNSPNPNFESAKLEAVKVNDQAAVLVSAAPVVAKVAPTPVVSPPIVGKIDMHAFFGSGSPAPAGPSISSVVASTPAQVGASRPQASYDTSARSPQPSTPALPYLGSAPSLNHPSLLSSTSRPFAATTQSFVPQMQHQSFTPSSQPYNSIPPSPSYQHQQQQHQQQQGQHSSYSQHGKSAAQNIPNGNNNQYAGNNNNTGGAGRSNSYVGSPVMQNRGPQQQQMGGQSRTQFPSSPRSPNAGLPNQMMYQNQQWTAQQQPQPYPGQQQQQQQPPFNNNNPYYPYPANYAQQQAGQVPLNLSGSSTPSAGLRTPASAVVNLPSNSPLISGQPSLVNTAAAPPFSPAFLTSPQPTPAALPQYHNQFSSPVSQRVSAAQSPFSLVAGAAEFRPSPKRTSAAIRIVNPKDVSSPLKPAPAFTPKEVSAVVENDGNSVAEEARKIEEARSVEEAKKADDERAAKEAAVASEATAKVATEALATAALAAAVAVKAEADQAESDRLSKVQADKEAADAKLAADHIATADAAIAASAAVADVISLDSSAADKVKKDAPAALDLEAIKSTATPAPALASALLTARVIDNLNAVTYPADIKSPRPDLNVDAEPGKFRYDRDFLLQFMAVCQEKPEQLPNLEAIGMVDAGVGGNNSQGGFRRSSASMGPPALPGRGAAAGGFGGARTASMGQFSGGMGNFGGSGLSSEDRFKASLPGGSRSSSSGGFPARTGGSMSRTSSQPGTMASGGNLAAGNGPQGARIRSNRGKPRGHEGGGGGGNKPGQHTTGQGFEDAAPLEATANRWTPTVVGGTGAVVAAPDSPEMVQRKVKALLNKLTLERFESISEQILAWANKSEEEEDGRILRQVIALIFEKATDEANWSAMYAQLCRKLNETVSNNVTDLAVKGPDGKLLAGGSLFRKYLLNRCQEDYESGWKQKEVAAAAAASKADDDNAKKGANEAAKEKEEEEAEAGVEATSSAPKEAELLSDEYYAAQKAKRRGLGLVRFIGELYRLQMLTERIMHECIKKLLANVDNPDEEDIESLCRLLTTVGKMLDNVKAKSHLDIYFLRMSQMVENMKISSRIRFMLQDVVELRGERWTPRHDSAGPKLISEIHSDAQRASQEATRRAASSNGKGMPRLEDQMHSRPGSRRGQPRDNFGAPAVDANGWSVPTPQRPAKAGDLTGFGKAIRSSGPTLGGPSGHFAKGAKAKEAVRPSTPSNAFAALEALDSPAASTTPQRQRIILAPRTIPKEGMEIETTDETVEAPVEEDAAGEEEEEEDDDGAIDPNAVSMSRAEGERRAGNSVKEFFAVKSLSEGIASVEALPVEYRGILVAAFAEAVMQLKADQVSLTRSLFAAVAAKSIVSHSVFISALTPLMVGVIDIAVDVPSAFNFASLLLLGAGLNRVEVENLAKKMASDEEDEETVEEAKLKMMVAFDKLAE